MEKKPEQFNKFNFFHQEEIKDCQTDTQLQILNDVQISKCINIENTLFFGNFQDNYIYAYEESRIVGKFLPFNNQLLIIERGEFDYSNVIITYGIDIDNQVKTSSIKLFEFGSIKYEQTENKPKKQIVIGKVGQPIKTFQSFAVSFDFTALAFGLADGNIYYLKSKNILTSDFKDQKIQAESKSIKKLFFSRFDGKLNLFYTTDDGVYVYYDEITKKRNIYRYGGEMFDLSSRGTLVGCTNDNNYNVKEFNLQNEINN